MKIGMNLPVMVPGLDRDAILEWSQRIDAGPFSHIAAGERITFPNPEIVVTLSAAAAVTSRARILLNVLVLPMHSAVLKAKQLATLDVVAGGRLSVEPRPLQPGGPEILSGSLSAESVRLAAHWADGICGFSFGPSVAEVDASFQTAREAWKEAERATPPRLITNCWFALGPAAREQIDRYLQRYLRFLGPGVAEKLAPSVTTTSVQALVDVVRRLADCGTDELSLVPTTADPDEIDRVVDALA
jgi:alkanesulfonate monooxygenase SsuD/methylene tetrahydromethanopterin reductase-like flavin-dependent oxidoreductase (luciferase family)